jgi:hypothetical protein
MIQEAGEMVFQRKITKKNKTQFGFYKVTHIIDGFTQI